MPSQASQLPHGFAGHQSNQYRLSGRHGIKLPRDSYRSVSTDKRQLARYGDISIEDHYRGETRSHLAGIQTPIPASQVLGRLAA